MPGHGQPTEELQWILQAIAGNKESFGRLYDLYFAQIYRYLFYRLADDEEAMDLTSQVFLNAWHQLPNFGRNKKFQFRAWLFRIAHNLMVDTYRATKATTQLEQIVQLPDKEENVLQNIEEHQEAQRLALAIRKLDERSQAVISCRFISNLSHKETAQVLNLTEGNVRILQMRALQKLKDELNEGPNE